MDNKILPAIQLRAWEKLARLEDLPKFYLAGGTAIALHQQHRESIDFDFFTKLEFFPQKLVAELGKQAH